MRTKSKMMALTAAFMASLLLSACDDAEQGRILMYEKGTYLGQRDRALTMEEQSDLRARTRMQQGS